MTVFQFTPLREGRPTSTGKRSTTLLFQFTPLREGRRRHASRQPRDVDISIHAPPRGATPSRRMVHPGRQISIHAPPRGATFPASESPGVGKISIHAPPRGATDAAGRAIEAADISIHAPPRGATLRVMVLHSRFVFQFTPLREGRQVLVVCRRAAIISIHAPPRGATREIHQRLGILPISIHAPPRGATGVSFSCLLWLFISIHAPPRGATALGSALGKPPTYFNSRPSARGDVSCSRSFATSGVFQFTPLREGRRHHQADGGRVVISIHAPPRGATLTTEGNPVALISIHAPPRGATIGQNAEERRGTYFNSRPSARGDATADIIAA